MPATVTLATTTLAQTVRELDSQIKVASTAGMFPGTALYVDGELMTVVRIGIDPWVLVLRGVDGTPAAIHVSAAPVYIGRPDQFYSHDPVGRPPSSVAVSPWINVRNGRIWFAQGDVIPIGQSDRWWQPQTATHEIGALGVRITTLDPTSST